MTRPSARPPGPASWISPGGRDLVEIRPALAEDIPALNALALRSKQHWNYPEAWMAEWRTSLTLRTEDLVNWEVLVAADDAVAGFAAVDVAADPCELEHLWIDPDRLGEGLGTTLLMPPAPLFFVRAASAGDGR